MAARSSCRLTYRLGGSTERIRLQASNLTRHTFHVYSVSHQRSHTNVHRPTIKSRTCDKTIPMTQNFRTSVPERASYDNSTIDFCFFPLLLDSSGSDYDNPRVPLLPDNYTPNRSLHSTLLTDSLDTALPEPEISIVASHPEHSLPAAISETFDNDGLDLNLSGLIAPATNQTSEIPEDSILKGLWHGVIEDIIAPKLKVEI
ncbi:hypothetical protein K3495_g963 [Podosphaera aphanis]|nr:hypothetical protein K3495_g963 [Podosphaera aphanis]